ncbi:MAG: alpha-amylase family glycosyl hydrolase [Chthoniobacterales bacterium]
MRRTLFLRTIFVFLLFADAGYSQQPLGAVVNKSGTTVTGVTFRVWAPNATAVAVRGDFNSWVETAMTKDNATGDWTATVPDARPGQEYKYFLRWAGNTGGAWKHDPRAFLVRNGNSVIYDHSAFDWGTTLRPSIPVDQQVMYELHIGSFFDPSPADNRPGTFDDAISRLGYLQGLGVNVIALMPVNEFGGDYSWGYNPEHLFAIESAYGGPDGLKRLVKAAHERGMKVQLDVVHNHWNPPGDGLWEFDGVGNIYFYPDNPQGWTAWGSRPDYAQTEVRRFIRENIQSLLDDFRVDGFRWDSPQNILGYDAGAPDSGSVGNPQTVLPEGKSLLTEINRMIHAEYPARWSIAEDADLLTVRPEGTWYPAGGFLDLLRVDDAADSFDGHWQTSFHNTITPQIAAASPDVGEILGKVSGWSEPPGYRVIFTDNHDKSGILNNQTRLANRMDPLDPTGRTARKKTILNAALTLTAPGTPMLWMGQEFQATGPFSDSVPLDWRSASAQHRIFRAHRDLVGLRETMPALRNSDLATAPGGVDEVDDLLVYWRRVSGAPDDDVVVFMNFSGQTRSDINVPFPSPGTWHVQMNTDWQVYGDDFGNVGPGGSVSVSGSTGSRITIAPHSAIIFARTTAPAGVALDDMDGNGLPDGWEAMTGLNNSSSSSDPDGDGISNLAELRRLSDPLIADRMSLAGDRAPLAWTPDNAALRMTWSDARQSWEWVGSFSGTYQFKFASGPGWVGANYGTGAGVPPGTASAAGANNLSNNFAVGRYRIAFNEFSGAYSITGYPVSTEWWETNALPAPLPTNSSDPRWDHDPNGDGFSHRLEYALGGSPVAANGSGLFSSWQTNAGGSNRLVLQWLQRTNGGTSLGIAPMVSTDLAIANWTTNGVSVATNVNQFNVPAGFQRREASVPMDGGSKFLRLRVTGP